MTGTMTWVGLDVHARSTQAVALDALSGELERRRLPGEAEAVVAWLRRLPRPVRACYEAGRPGSCSRGRRSHLWYARRTATPGDAS